MSGRMGRRTAVFIFLVTASLVLLTNIPLLYGYLKQSPDMKFMGIVAGVRDSNFYFMMMTQGDGWSPILRNYFASGEPNAIYHGLFWFMSGKIGNILRVEDLAVYHGARVVITIVFVFTAYWFVSRFLTSTFERIAALTMLSFGAGAGWLPMLRYRWGGGLPFVPTDVGTPEASSFFTLMTFPHLSAALVLIALCFGLVEASVSEKRVGWAAAAGFSGMFLGFIHPVNLVVICAGLGLFAVASLVILKESRPLRHVVIFGALSIWPVVYYIYLTLVEPELLPQVPVRSPAPIAYLVGFAPYIILSSIHVVSLVRARSLPRGDLLLICWIISNSLLLYSYPILSQEARAVLGLQLPLVVLSARAIFSTILPRIERGWGAAGRPPRKALAVTAAVLIVVFTFPSSFYNIFERVWRLKNYPELFSLRIDEYEALRFLRDARGEDVVLSGDWIGNYVPRVAHKRSWLGQYDLPSHDSRLKTATAFFSSDTPISSRYDLLEEHNLGFVYYGPDERMLGGFNPERAELLERIFRSDSVDIFRFRRDRLTSEELRSQ